MMRFLVPTCLLLLSCGGSHTDGVVLSLEGRLSPRGDVTRDATGWHFTRTDGAQVTLTRGLVALRSVELVPCPASALRRVLEALSPIGTAHAHEEGSPRKLGVPHVLALARDTEARLLGSLYPPPGRYCSARIVLAPADADAEGLGGDGDMVERTLLLEGTLRTPGATSDTAFRLESRGAREVEVPLEMVDLGETQLRAGRRLVLAFDAWMEGISPGTQGASQEVLSAVAASMSVAPVVAE
ncbi:MAG: hypothetical protein L0Y66_17060 [Myxococcaceae bacterium]|nr:hypothetical protein [Myxococcaceae bacterium]MCI0672141.1 hypothetical protein [Myxococcaceae bacterium]